MWDLVVGRSAFSQKLTSEPDLVQWSPTGDYYAVVLNNKVDIYAAKVRKYSTLKSKQMNKKKKKGRIHLSLDQHAQADNSLDVCDGIRPQARSFVKCYH